MVEICCHHFISYAFQLAAQNVLYEPSITSDACVTVCKKKFIYHQIGPLGHYLQPYPNTDIKVIKNTFKKSLNNKKACNTIRNTVITGRGRVSAVTG